MNRRRDLLDAVEQFIYREARLLDTQEYVTWESLWTDDACYWVPAGSGDCDPERSMSLIYDNRSRIALRVRQLETGRRHAQNPPSRLARLISNIEIISDEREELTIGASQMVFESNLRGETIWASRNEYALRRTTDDLSMVRKTVVLANCDKPLHTLAFLI